MRLVRNNASMRERGKVSSLLVAPPMITGDTSMTNIRKLFLFVFAIAVTAFAMPATAAKLYTLNMSSVPAPLVAGVANQAASMKLNNISNETGNANTSSFKLVAGNGITIKAPVSGTAVPLGGGYTATIQNNGSSIYVSNIQLPLKPFGPSLVLNMTVDVSCTATGKNWNMLGVWTGSGFTGQTFTFTNSPPNTSTPDTPVTGICGSISFASQPADAFAGTVAVPTSVTTVAYDSAGAPVKVKLLANGNPSPGVTPTVSVTASCAVTASATATDAAGLSTLTLTSTGSSDQSGCVITASANQYGSVNSNAFNLKAPAGILGCTTGNNFVGNPAYDPDGDGPFWGDTGYALRRYDNRTADTNGNYCPYQIPFTFTFDENGASAFLADKLGQDIIVEYVLVLKPRATTLGWPDALRPYFAFGIVNPVFPDDYHPGQACNNDDPANAKNVTPLPGTEQMCAAQLGWTGVSPGYVQWWLKVIDVDGFVRAP